MSPATERRVRTALAASAALTSAVWSGCAPQPARERQEVRCVFIDAGAHRGQSYSAFIRSGLYSKYDWEIFAIEANPNMMDKLPPAPRLTAINKALWTGEGTLELNMVGDTSGSNTLLNPNVEHETYTIPVETFDFSAWLKENFSEDDVVVLSMDIEGAEYEIMKKMIADKSVRYVDRLYIEVHPWLLEDMEFNEASAVVRSLLNDFRRRGVAVVEDSVEDAMKAGLWLDFLIYPPVRQQPAG